MKPLFPKIAFQGSDISGGARLDTRAPVQPADPAVAAQAEDDIEAFASVDMGEFVEEIYLATNPDVAQAIAIGQFTGGWHHWQTFGEREYAEKTRPSILFDSLYTFQPLAVADRTANTDSEHFDSEMYLYRYPDVRNVVKGSHQAALDHWLHYGRHEGRTVPKLSPRRQRHVNPGEVLQRPFGFNVYGPFAAISGLGTAARSTVRALLAANIPVELWNFDTSKGHPRVTDADRERKPRYRVNLLLANADLIGSVMAQLPPEQFDDAYNIAIWQWELASFRPDWFEAFEILDEVWSNSDFQVTAITASAPVPVHKISLPVEPVPPRKPVTRAEFGLPDESFIFFCPFDIGSTSARKNPFSVIAAFKEAFGKRRDVFLVLKFHANRTEPGFVGQLNRALKGMTNYLVIAEEFTADQMCALRAVCDCLVSPHRSEGFGLNIAEFLALGKPVIATDYSGSRDFFDASVGFPIDYKLIEIAAPAGPYRTGFVWADPQHDSLVTQLLRVMDDPKEVARRGQQAAVRMEREFSYKAVGRQMLDRVAAIGLDAKPIAFLGWLGKGDEKIYSDSPLSVPPERHSTTSLRDLPLMSVVIPVYNVAGDLLEACIRSVAEQSYPYWELCLCNDGSTRSDTVAVLNSYRGRSPKIKIRDLPGNSGISGASNAAAELATGEWIVLLDNDDEIERDALWEVVKAVNANPSIDCLYSDEDKLDMDGNQIDHFHKPDWSPEHLESVMYVLHMFVIRKRLFHEIGGFRPAFDGAQDFDLMLRISRATENIHHIPKVLYHWRAIPGSSADQVDAKPTALLAGERALLEHVRIKYGPDADVEEGLTQGTFRVRRPMGHSPRASLVILTNNGHEDIPGRGNICLVENFIDSIIKKTDYKNYEIIVVDNSSLSAAQIRRMRSLGVRVENYELPNGRFNYAAKANHAMRCVRTEHVVLLNDDMEVISPDWLTALLELIQDPEIGAVGARLLHFDGSIQHIGTVLGVNGSVAHPYHSYPRDFIGYNGFTHLIRNYSAVTAACFATRRSVMSQIGGFDESFAVDFNDIDLCLRIREAGYRIVYTPYAELYHFEGASAKRTSQDPVEVSNFLRRWAKWVENDPYYNTNLARDRLDFACRPQSEPVAPASD